MTRSAGKKSQINGGDIQIIYKLGVDFSCCYNYYKCSDKKVR